MHDWRSVEDHGERRLKGLGVRSCCVIVLVFDYNIMIVAFYVQGDIMIRDYVINNDIHKTSL
jgi:hypothetical protein